MHDRFSEGKKCLVLHMPQAIRTDGLSPDSYSLRQTVHENQQTAHEWPRTLLYAFPPIVLISPTLYRVREEGLKLILIALRWPGKYWLAEIIHMLYKDPWSLPLCRDLLSSRRGDFSSTSRTPGTMGLACEWFNLNTTGLSDSVIRTIQNTRASSTRSLYECKWGVFERWCATKHEIPFQCSVAVVLSFLQDLIDQGKAFSTIKVFLAAISACYIGFDNKTVGQHPLVCRFMKGARRALPVSKPISPSWDLGLVLDALSMSPFEPLDKVDLKILSFKTALLLALASAKRVSEIHAFSVHSACLQFLSGDAGVVLKFMPQIIKAIIPLELRAFYSPPFASSEQQKLNALCPVHALRIYTERTSRLPANWGWRNVIGLLRNTLIGMVTCQSANQLITPAKVS